MSVTITDAGTKIYLAPPVTSEQLGTFYKGLVAQGISEQIAAEMVAKLFEAFLYGTLGNLGAKFDDFT